MHKFEDPAVCQARMSSGFMVPQVKICGLTRKDEAVTCAALGANAIGFIFYRKSPRKVTPEQAHDIAAALPARICRVGVFVDECYEKIVQTAQIIGLRTIQLHGAEPPALVEKLKSQGLRVLKTLFNARKPFYKEASSYGANAYLIESGLGPLPGGNARTWDYSKLAGFTREHPLVLAGGLSLHNIVEAIQQCQPDAVDISSGVELSPGRKDLKRVKSIISAVRSTCSNSSKRRIFHADS